MEQYTWVNPNITHAGPTNLLPFYKGLWPTTIYDDGPWLVTRGVNGFIVTDLWAALSWETMIQDMYELQVFVTMEKGPL